MQNGLTYGAYNETLVEQKTEDKLKAMEGQYNTMQSQVCALIAAIGSMMVKIGLDLPSSYIKAEYMKLIKISSINY